jgi:Peptidase A4 family
MLFKHLGVFSAIATLPAMAQVSSAPSHAAVLKAFQAQHGPIRIVVQHDDGSVESTNWSGYAVTGSKFTKATGSWIEPTVKCNKKTDTELAAFWVGLDGYQPTSPSVEQIGTLAQCVGGQVEHFAWWEFYPTNDIQEITTVSVKAGDKISTSVTFANSEFTLKLTDETTGKSFTHKGNQSAQRSSAEWIAEAPCCVSGNTVYPIPDWGTALFGKDSTSIANTNNATNPSHHGAFNTFPGADVFKITMVNASTSATEASPSAPSSDGSSFSVQWVSP